MDIHCDCGEHSHIDSDFAYYVTCPKCKATFMVNGHVELVKLTKDEVPHTEPVVAQA